MKVSIIIPVYNEEKRLPNCIDSLNKFIFNQDMDFEIIISADGCTDDTLKIAENYAKMFHHIRVASFSERLGKGGGILNALRVATGDIVVISDVDLSAPPEQIIRLLAVVEDEEADLVFGSRNLPGSVILVEPPFHRKILGKVFNFFFRLLFGIRLHDTQCGFKAVRKSVLNDLSRNLNIEGYAFDIDLTVKAKSAGYKIVEKPITWLYVRESRVDTLRQIFSMGRDLLIIWLEQQKREVFSSDEVSVRRFYGSIPGDVYQHAIESWFLPRRLWHRHKNKTILNNILDDSLDVLDAGCGSGTLIGGLLPRKKSVYGVDVGEGFISFSHSKYGQDNAFFICADVQHLPIRNGFFDTIVCSEVLEHVADPEQAIGEFNRALKHGGRLIVTTPNISLRWSFIEALWTRIRPMILETQHRAFTRRRLRYLLLSAGFDILTNHTFMLGCLILAVAEKKNQKG